MEHKELKPCPFCGGAAENTKRLTYREGQTTRQDAKIPLVVVD